MKNLLRIGVCWAAVGVCFFADGALMVVGQATVAPAHRPLQRVYHEGDTLVYKMNGVNESWHYSIEGDGVVKKNPGGAFYEEFRWSNMTSGGQPMVLRADSDAYRQRLSLDPNQIPSAPDLTKADPKMIGPITDLMTFYADLWLANKLGALTKAGDHFYFRNPMPASSWADGTHTLIGESAIDFDVTLKAVDAAAGTATLVVKHVPPEKSSVKLPAAWMQTPVGDAPNNWVGVTKKQNGTYTASVGEEKFTDEIKVSLADGKILSATMDNPVKAIERVCEDEALTKCGDAKPHDILRKIEIVEGSS